MAPRQTYYLTNGVNGASVGSIVVDEKGYSTDDLHEQRWLDAHPDLVRGRAKAAKAAKAATAAKASAAAETAKEGS